MSTDLTKYYQSALTMANCVTKENGLVIAAYKVDDKEIPFMVDGGTKFVRVPIFDKEVVLDDPDNTTVFHTLSESLSRDKDSVMLTVFKKAANQFANMRVIEIAKWLADAKMRGEKFSPTLSKELEFLDDLKAGHIKDLKNITDWFLQNISAIDKRLINFVTKRRDEVDGVTYQCVARAVYSHDVENDKEKHLFDIPVGSKVARSVLYKLFDYLLKDITDPSVHMYKTNQDVAPSWYATTKAFAEFHRHLNRICVLAENIEDAPVTIDLSFEEFDGDLLKFRSQVPVNVYCQGTTDEIEAKAKEIEEKERARRTVNDGTKISVAKANRHGNQAEEQTTSSVNSAFRQQQYGPSAMQGDLNQVGINNRHTASQPIGSVNSLLGSQRGMLGSQSNGLGLGQQQQGLGLGASQRPQLGSTTPGITSNRFSGVPARKRL
tara:strand:- start:155977 stop:157281 length:1305 start_codon:yes stop_codon:yes gene_type:complete